jgi:SAM-dependent methyltransferase
MQPKIPLPNQPNLPANPFFSNKIAVTDEQFWDNQASLPGYQGVVVDDEKLTSTSMLYNFMSNQLNFENKIVLDIGCGLGRLFPVYLQNQAREIHGVDLSLNMIRLASFKYPNPNIYLTQGHINNLNQLQNNFFSICICVTILCHISDEKIVKTGLDELFRVTERDGILFLCEPMSFNRNSYFEHSHMTLRPSNLYKKWFFSSGFDLETENRECFGPIDHPDSWRTVMIFSKRNI